MPEFSRSGWVSKAMKPIGVYLVGAGMIICLMGLLIACSPQITQTCPGGRAKMITTIRENGGRVDWSGTNNLIAFDALGDDGFYDLYVMQPDGLSEACLTCDKAGLIPQKHIGNPAWHPSGDYLVFQAEKEVHPGSSGSATPGFGLYNDLWLVNRGGDQFVKLIETGDGSGVLHPHFSHDGRLLAWSELIEEPNLLEKGQEFGYWRLKVAEFSIGQAGPALTNIQEIAPDGPAFYENHGFSPDGTKLIFSSNFGRAGSVFQNNDIYALELATMSVTALTQENYNEHAHYSPDGRTIVWMSNAGTGRRGTDYWLMKSDGSDKERLTYFNQPGCPEYAGENVTVADSSWSPSGDQLAAYIQTDLFKQIGKIVIITLNEAVE